MHACRAFCTGAFINFATYTTMSLICKSLHDNTYTELINLNIRVYINLSSQLMLQKDYCNSNGNQLHTNDY